MTFRHKKRAPIKKGVFLWEKGAHKFRCVCLRTANKHKCSVRRNGRRTGLKIPRWQHRVGSTPTTSTIGENGIFARFRFFFKKQKPRPNICFRPFATKRNSCFTSSWSRLIAMKQIQGRLFSSRYGGSACFFSLHKNAKAFIVSLH